MNQVMGGPPGELMLNPTAWAHVELDLFGPFNCKSDVNSYSYSCFVNGVVVFVGLGQ